MKRSAWIELSPASDTGRPPPPRRAVRSPCQSHALMRGGPQSLILQDSWAEGPGSVDRALNIRPVLVRQAQEQQKQKTGRVFIQYFLYLLYTRKTGKVQS